MPICKYFNTPKGCKKGSNCSFKHDTSSRGASPSSDRSRSSSPTTSNSKNKSTNGGMVPKGVCRTYWQTGHCASRLTCRYSHTTTASQSSLSSSPSKRNQVRSLLSSSANGEGGYFSSSRQKAESQAQDTQIGTDALLNDSDLANPTTAATTLQYLLRPQDPLKSSMDAIRFSQALLATVKYSNEPGSGWSYSDAQAILLDLTRIPGDRSDGKAKMGLIKILDWELTVGTDTMRLSFQRGLMPVVMYMTSETVLKSSHDSNVNSLFNILDKTANILFPRIKLCLENMMETQTVRDRPSVLGSMWVPASFLHIFRPIIELLNEYLTRFRTACAEHPIIQEFILVLESSFETWSTDLLSSDPKFTDSQTQSSIEHRQFLVNNIRGSLTTLMQHARLRQAHLHHPSRALDGGGDTSGKAVAAGVIASFKRDLGSPGGRHSNDHAEISNIEIIPTKDELLCTQRIYLPPNFPSAPHHLEQGTMERHFDILFRLLREDFVSPIRSSIQNLVRELNTNEHRLKVLLAKGGGRYRSHSSQSPVDLNLYANAHFKGLKVADSGEVVSRVMSRTNLASSSLSKSLQAGNLIGVLYSTDQQWNLSEVQMFLGYVAKTVPDYTNKLVETMINFYDAAAYRKVIDCMENRYSPKGMILFEVPNLLLESVRPFLRALQTTAPVNIPFANILARSTVQGIKIDKIEPPLYARAPDFRFDLKSLLQKGDDRSLFLNVQDPVSVTEAKTVLRDSSRLDPSQVDSLVDSLSREVAVTEGPPGTGKSYLGVEIIRVLLANHIRRIVTIAFTNHAIDQILQSLLDANVTDNLVRVGSRSKSETIASFSLHDALRRRRESGRHPASSREYGATKARIEGIEKDILQICKRASGARFSGDYLPKELLFFLRDFNPFQHQAVTAPPQDLANYFDVLDDGGWSIQLDLQGRPSDDPPAWWAKGYDLLVRENSASPAPRPPPPPRQAHSGSAIQPARNRFQVLAQLDGFDFENDDDDDSENVGEGENDLWGWQNEVDDIDIPDDMINETFGDDAFSSSGKEDVIYEEPGELPFLHPPPSPDSNRSVEELKDELDVWNMSRQERKSLMVWWKDQHATVDVPRLERLREEHRKALETLQEFRDGDSLEILRDTDVIGCTTTGAARVLPMLRRVAPEALVIEEAGEVLEATALANLVPSIQHFIMIGDCKQLRPHVACFNLSMDSSSGKDYRLDESLFERLVNAGMPISILKVQRRMRPEISQLIRPPLYPTLEDHERVKEYPGVKGIQQPLLFIDHQHPEDRSDRTHSSKSNTWEVDMIAELVLYLLKLGYCNKGDIAVLTPYLGQLSKFKKRFATEQVNVILDERDEKDLDAVEEEEDGPDFTIRGSLVQKASVSSQVTFRTIDNFQGEEAKIIILSLVRNVNSTEEAEGAFLPREARASIGFLKSPNRTNVALSRAQHGLYIFGNGSLLKEKSQIWRSVLEQLGTKNSVVASLPIVCAAHGEVRQIDEVGQLPEVAPQGGCLRTCAMPMPCGHPCRSKCHPEDLEHKAFKCGLPCARILSCNHPCSKVCSAKCGDCTVPIKSVPLPCGHTREDVPCDDAQHPELLRCHARVTRTLPCGHQLELLCQQDVKTVQCRHSCDSRLPCRHKICRAPCCDCDRATGKHSPHPCEKDLLCTHRCTSHSCCKTGESCPPCSSPCIRHCPHQDCNKGKMKHKCSQLCKPCLSPCSWGSCEHGKGTCNLPCGQPCSRLPCDEPCNSTLKCGCPCPSVCCEVCDFQICPKHAPAAKYDQVVDLIMQRTLKDVVEDADPEDRLITLNCGHLFTVETLDGHFALKEFYSMDAKGKWQGLLYPDQEKVSERPVTCPQCRAPIAHTFARRYGRVIKRLELDSQERTLMANTTGALSHSRTEFEKISTLEIVTKLKERLSDLNKLTSCPLSLSDLKKARARFLNGSPTEKAFTQPEAFERLQLHGLSKQIHDAWRFATNSIMRQYRELATIIVNKPAHTAAYDAAWTQLYREEIQRITNGEYRVRDPIRYASQFADTSVGSSRPLADERLTIESIWTTVEQRLSLYEVSQALIDHLVSTNPETNRATLKTDLLRARKFSAFILESCYRDLRHCLEKASQSNSRKQIVQSCSHLFAVSFQLCDFNMLCSLKMNQPTEAFRKQTADIGQKFLDEITTDIKQRCSNFGLEGNGMMVGNSSLGECINGLRSEMTRITERWKDRIEEARQGAIYRPVTQEERLKIITAMSFGTTGHWFRCPKGHTYTIADCGGANQVSTCPECGARIGGQSHTLSQGNRRDREMEGIALSSGVPRAVQVWDDRD